MTQVTLALTLASLSASAMSLTCDSNCELDQTPLTLSWTFGPLQITEYPPESGNPDSATLYSRWANTTAPTIDVGPLPSPGTVIILQADIPGLFVFDARYTIQPGDTPQSVAQSVAQTFNAGAGYPSDAQAMQQAGVVAGNVPGTTTIWVTNPISGGVVTLSDQSPQPAFVNVKAGSSAWDAGPVIACGKIPQAGSQGIAPPPGSNICQFFAVAYGQGGTGPLQYLTIGVNVKDAATGDAELAVYTQNTRKKILSLSSEGLVVNGQKLQ